MLMGLGWCTPRIQYIDVPLPSLKMTATSERPTFIDHHRIRAKVKLLKPQTVCTCIYVF